MPLDVKGLEPRSKNLIRQAIDSYIKNNSILWSFIKEHNPEVIEDLTSLDNELKE